MGYCCLAMEHVIGFKVALSNAAAKEFEAFECVLRDELARRKSAVEVVGMPYEPLTKGA